MAINPDCRDLFAALNAAGADQEVPVISRAHLIRNKRASGRPQDLIDVEILEGMQAFADQE
jgi:hypothetical protein